MHVQPRWSPAGSLPNVAARQRLTGCPVRVEDCILLGGDLDRPRVDVNGLLELLLRVQLVALVFELSGEGITLGGRERLDFRCCRWNTCWSVCSRNIRTSWSRVFLYHGSKSSLCATEDHQNDSLKPHLLRAPPVSLPSAHGDPCPDTTQTPK
jgi:hypothetical protein